LQLFPTFSKLKSILSADIRDIRKIFNLSLTDPKAWDTSLWNMIGSQSVSGESVSEHSALTYSAVYDAVGQISATISTLPLHLLRSDANKTIQAEEKRLFRVMHSEFNKYMTAQIGREVLAAHVLTWGNAYAEKVYNGYGEIIELWPITPDRVRMEMRNGELIYLIRVGGELIPLTRAQVLHIPGLGFDGFQGYSVISMARKSIGLGMALETFGAMYFGNGTHPGTIVSHPLKLDPITKSNLQNTLTTAYSGLGQSHRLMLLEEGMKIEKVGIPPNDSQFLESRTFQISDIARWYHIPLHKLKEMTRATNNNIESEQATYYVDCILPWLIRMEQCFDQQLLSDTEKWKQHYYFKHNVDALLRASSIDRANYHKIMWGSGFVTQNEVRAKENLDPYPDPSADELFVPINNMIPLSKIDDFIAKQNSVPAPSNAPKEAVP
jgi:HK97 family phage portal protein